VAEKLPFGVVCETSGGLAALQDRCRVSRLQVLGGQQALELGYGGLSRWEGKSGIIVPSDDFRRVPDDTIGQLVADEGTEYPLHIVRLPKTLGERAMKETAPRTTSGGERDPTDYSELIPGLQGVFLEVRHDRANRRSTSVDSGLRSQVTYMRPFVGMHIDEWPESLRYIRYFIANLGPGSRFHCLAPGVLRRNLDKLPPKRLRDRTFLNTLEILLARGHAKRGEDLRFHPRGELLSQWAADPWADKVVHLELKPPGRDENGQEYVEALVGSPVPEVLHDGSTRGSRMGSRAVMASVEMATLAAFPSALSRTLWPHAA
jgi:hypothetical protein